MDRIDGWGRVLILGGVLEVGIYIVVFSKSLGWLILSSSTFKKV